MAYTYSVHAILDLIRTYIVSDFTEQSETPSSVPYTSVAKEYQISADNIPMTLIEIKGLKIDHDGVNQRKLCQSLVIHHVRKRVPNANAEITCIDRLAHFAATLENDPCLTAVNTDGILIQITRVTSLIPSDDYELAQTSQNISLAGASLDIEICWNETRL